MEFVRRSWAQIRAYLAGLSFSERALVVMSVVVLVVVLAWILPLLIKPEMEKVNFAGERQAEAVQRLQAANIKAAIVNGALMVPAGKTDEALSILAQNDLLSADITAAFDEYVKRYSPLYSNAQSARQFLMAKEKVLSALVSKMAGVKAATVMVSMPEEQGFGRSAPKPTASVTVFMKSRSSVDKPLVAAIAGLVAGANSPMKVQDVVVVDALNGRSLTTGSDEELLPATALAHIRENEDRYRSKIEDSLSYITGRVVSVTVQIDPKIHSNSENWDYNKNQPLVSETSKTNKSTDTASAAEPGPRSNAGTDLNNSGGPGTTREETTTSTTFAPSEMIRRTQTVEVGLLPKQVNVNVGVPRSYFVNLFKVGKPADKATDPDEAALAPIIQAQLAQIEAQVQNLIAADGKGTVKAYVMNTDALAITTVSAPGAGGSGLLVALDSGWARPVGLAMLALVSLTLMFGMVRKATRQQPMPSVQELAGVPLALPTDDDLVGEADETDPSMAGVELDEDELRTRKIAQQIGEMVKTNPAEAASLVRRWVRTEE